MTIKSRTKIPTTLKLTNSNSLLLTKKLKDFDQVMALAYVLTVTVTLAANCVVAVQA